MKTKDPFPEITEKLRAGIHGGVKKNESHREHADKYVEGKHMSGDHLDGDDDHIGMTIVPHVPED